MTDDGGMIYVHLFPKEGSAEARGRAFVLAWQDYAEDPPRPLECYRWLIGGPKLNLRENVGKVRWLKGR